MRSIASFRVRLFLLPAVICAGCAAIGSLSQLVQPPHFEEASDRPAEISLFRPSASQPAGGAGVRLWLQVTNPNSFGFTLSTLNGTLMLEGTRAATGDFPLGVPLGARGTTVVPLDLSLEFADLPGLAGAIAQAANGRPVAYELEGTVGVDAGRLGTPTFGPMLLVRGEVRPRIP